MRIRRYLFMHVVEETSSVRRGDGGAAVAAVSLVFVTGSTVFAFYSHPPART